MSEPSFPSYRPTARSFTTGTFPIKTFQAQNGAEIRIKYGNQLTGKRLRLTYANLQDSQAQEFMDHYISMSGSFLQFSLDSAEGEGVRAGWKGKREGLGAGFYRMKYRYASEPQIESVYINRSTVSIELIATPI